MAPPARSASLRVLSIPDDHPYVERCRPAGVVPVLARPGADGASAGWEPSPAFEPAWLAAHHGELDAVHLHFGFDHLSPDDVRDWLDALHRYQLPLVLTVHDLRNPHHDTPERHDAHLDLLVPAASAVITLTDSAAAVIQQRWGRTASVIAHPHVADLNDLPARTTAPRGRAPRAGIHLKDLRRNLREPARLVAAAARGAHQAGGLLQVDVHPGVLARPELAGLHDLAAAGAIDLRPHPRFSDRELIGYLAGLDVTVLPYRFGTHSGWLEAGRDVGTRVVAPTCGFYADQWSEVVTYRNDEEAGLDPASLTDAVRTALLMPAPVIDTRARRDQAETVREQHAEIYADVDVESRVAA